jgi:hypothetical protein
VSEQLSLQRLLWLLRSDALHHHRSWLVTSGTVALIVALVSLLGAWDRDVGPGFYDRVFIGTLFAWGTIATSQAFVDLHRRGSNMTFLLLPASALEKTVARLLLHTVGMFVYLLLLTTVLSFALEGINAVLFGVRREFFTPLDRTAWWILPHYLAVQGLFFVGAAWFRKAHFVKTVGAVLAIGFGLSFVAATIGWLLGPGGSLFEGRSPAPEFFGALEWVGETATIAYYFVLPVFCWFVAWLRVTEAQVSHGI